MKTLTQLLLATIALAGTQSLQAKLDVVATLPDYAAIAEEVGGREVKVTSLAAGTEDPHFVTPRPSYIRVLNRADMLIFGGADLEIGWLPPLVNNARNRDILPGGSGLINASRGIRLLEVQRGPIDRSQGHVHAAGNPHYSMDPANAKIIADQMAKAFGAKDPKHASDFSANANAFKQKLDAKLKEWESKLAPYQGTKVVTYHKNFEYFAARFGLTIVDQIEPKPGIEPTPGHIRELIPRMQQEGVKLILIEPSRSRRTPDQLANQTGAKVLTLPILVGGAEGTDTYLDWIDHLVNEIAGALQ